MSEHGLTALLRKRYAAPEFAFLPQVRNMTGFSSRIRTADAIAMGLYPSRGLHLHGFEIKSSRSDWTRERKDPDKADEIAKHCHFWNVVAPDDKIVPVPELPPTWGLLVMSKDGKSVRTCRAATFMEAEPITFKFLAGILRKASEAIIPKADIQKELALEYDRGKEAARKDFDYEVQQWRRKAFDAQQAIDNFSRQSGINISGYGGPHLSTHAQAVEVMRGHGWKRVNELQELLTHIERVLRSAQNEIKHLTANGPEPDYSI